MDDDIVRVPVNHQNTAPSSKKKRPKPSKKHLKYLVGLVLVIGLAWLIFSYVQTRNDLKKLSANPQSASQDEASDLVKKIGAYLTLPDEKPTLATVKDASKLSGQEFFKNAQNGDKVLVFASADRALLYRPSTQKVIEYAKVDLSTTKAQ